MDQLSQLDTTQGDIRPSRLLRQTIRLTLGLAHLVGTKKIREVSGTPPVLQDEVPVEPRSSSGVER